METQVQLLLMPVWLGRPQALMLLCEFVLNSTPAPLREQALYHTLLQLYLAECLLSCLCARWQAAGADAAVRVCAKLDARAAARAGAVPHAAAALPGRAPSRRA